MILITESRYATFPLDRKVTWRSLVEVRPTVVVVLVTPHQEVVMVLPKGARENDDLRQAFIFPQGGVNQNETPRTAVLRELREELHILGHSLESDMRWLCEGESETKKSGQPKYLIGVVATLRQMPLLRVNRENHCWISVAGPNCLWEKTGECSTDKKIFTAQCVRAAVKLGFLHGPRWRGRIDPYCQFVVM